MILVYKSNKQEKQNFEIDNYLFFSNFETYTHKNMFTRNIHKIFKKIQSYLIKV